jgi:hypothetical protein
MSTNAVALFEARSNQITDVQRLGGLLAASGYFSDARDMAQAAVKVLAGQELGIPPVAAMMGINIIKGKIALGGNLIASRIRAHGFDFIHKRFDSEACVLVFLGRKGDPEIGKGMVGTRPILGESSFTMEDAKTALLAGNENYKKNPRNMLFNRSISNGAKWYTPEVFAGAPVYVPEELGANVDENGDMVHPEPTREQGTAAQKQVLDRKLSEINERKQQKQETPVDADPVDAKPQTRPPAPGAPRRILTVEEFTPLGKYEKLSAFELMKEALGEPDYYRILGVCGVEHSNQFTKGSEAVRAYSEMLDCYNYAQSTRGVV